MNNRIATLVGLGMLGLWGCSAGPGGRAQTAAKVAPVQASEPVAPVSPSKTASAPLEFNAESESDRVFIENAERAIGQYSEFLSRAGDGEEYAQAAKRSREQIEDLQAAIDFVRRGAQERAFRQQ